MGEARRLGKAAALVREHGQVREVGLGFLGVVDSFHRDHDHAGVSLREIIMAMFELDQLGHTNRSPSAPKKDDRVVLITDQVDLAIRCAVRTPCLECREGPADGNRSRIGRQSQGA